MKIEVLAKALMWSLSCTVLLGLLPAAMQAQTSKNPFENCPDKSRWCIPKQMQDRILAAKARIPDWESREKRQLYWQNSTVQALPLTNTLLDIYRRAEDQSQPRNHYGLRQLHFHLRRAAYFVQQIFSDLSTITILRCNTDHPAPAPNPMRPDAHLNGTAADISYLTQGSGREVFAPIDYERNFWLIYALLHVEAWKDGIDHPTGRNSYLLMDYHDEIRAYARMARDLGLISSRDLNRFLSPGLRDKYHNHEDHIHIDVRGWGAR